MIEKINESAKGRSQTAKFFDWLWNSESIGSYVVFLILAFILIKFILFPFLSLTMGTSLPLAIVESCSMFHEGNLFSNQNNWWTHSESKYQPYSITKENFSQFPFQKGFNKGDLLVITGTNPKNLKIGDIIIFSSPDGRAIIHRIIKISNDSNGKLIFSTQGDHNPGQLPYEKEISQDRIMGKAQLKQIPYVGWIKLIFFEPFKSPSEKGLCKANY